MGSTTSSTSSPSRSAKSCCAPTDIYVREALEILRAVAGVHALSNITGDGLLNLARVAAPVGFKLDALIEPHPIFPLKRVKENFPDE
jgi:phosphoribosylaminoimidazole (AIR) synthetase